MRSLTDFLFDLSVQSLFSAMGAVLSIAVSSLLLLVLIIFAIFYGRPKLSSANEGGIKFALLVGLVFLNLYTVKRVEPMLIEYFSGDKGSFVSSHFFVSIVMVLSTVFGSFVPYWFNGGHIPSKSDPAQPEE